MTPVWCRCMFYVKLWSKTVSYTIPQASSATKGICKLCYRLEATHSILCWSVDVHRHLFCLGTELYHFVMHALCLRGFFLVLIFFLL